MKNHRPEDAGSDERPHPGVLLRDHVLPGIGLSISQAARELQVSRQTLHRIFDGTASVTPDMAARIESLTGVPSMFWLRRQSAFDLKRARASLVDVLAHIPRHNLSRAVMKQIGALGER